MIRTIREGDQWKLQTAVIHLRHPATERNVTLVAMIHIARAEYYTDLTHLLGAHRGLVLFEGVGELTPEQVAELSEDERKVWESLASLHGAYRRIAAALQLVAQPDAMPRPGPNWVRADLPVRDLLDRWVRARLPLIPAMDMAGQVLDSALMRRATRLVLLQEPYLLGVFQFLRGWAPGVRGFADLLVDARNDAALRVFDTVDPAQDVLMTYGAGHIPGLLAGFQARGYREIGRIWYTAHVERIPYSDVLDRTGDWLRVAFGPR